MFPVQQCTMFKTFVSRTSGRRVAFLLADRRVQAIAGLCKMRPFNCLSCKWGRSPVRFTSAPCSALLFWQVLLPSPGDIPPSPPGLQEQLSTVASFSTFQELLEVSSRGEHSCHCHNSLWSKCPPQPVLGDLNLAAW